MQAERNFSRRRCRPLNEIRNRRRESRWEGVHLDTVMIDEQVEFADGPDGVLVTVTFDTENVYPVEQQRAGWQAILDNFGRYVAARQ